MDAGEVKDQTKNWLEGRLRNPYFGAVIAIWLIENRVLVYSIFNFDEDFTLDQKVLFIHNKLQEFDRLAFINDFRGFPATVVWSLLVAFLVMVVFDQLNAVGKLLFGISQKTTYYIQRVLNGRDWVPRKDHEDAITACDKMEEELNEKKIRVKALTQESEDAMTLLKATEREKSELQNRIAGNVETLKLQEEQIRQATQEKNRLKIIYASYGNDDVFVEVTKIVNDELFKKNKITVNNEAFKVDPVSYIVKQLYVEYEVNGEQKTILAQEGMRVERENELFNLIETEESKASEQLEKNLKNLSDAFPGEWIMTATEKGDTTKSIIKLDEKGRFFINGKHEFDLLVTEFNPKRTTIRKIDRTNRGIHKVEILAFKNADSIAGQIVNSGPVDYKRKEAYAFAQ